MFVKAAINIPTDKIFTYAVPPALEKDICVGKRALLPFGKRKVTGYIVELSDSADCEEVKDIIHLLDAEPLFSREDFEFYRWLARYYIHPIGKTLVHILPGGIEQKVEQWVLPVKDGQVDGQITPVQRKILDILADYPTGLNVSRLKYLLGKPDIKRSIDALCRDGLLKMEERFSEAVVKPKKERLISLHSSWAGKEKLTAKEEKVMNFLESRGRCSMKVLQEAFANPYPTIKNLSAKGCILVCEQEINRPHDQSYDIGRTNGKITLNSAQEKALAEIKAALSGQRFSAILLHGVTGSGKTEVYLQAIQDALAQGGSVIYLVPEIALTPQLLSRFQTKFGNLKTAVIHSGIAPGSRFDQWRQIQRDEIKVVVGARSALFAPVRNLKLIICDEEHDNSYKQEDRIRYHARDLAVVKAQLAGATVVLGSATPGLQTFHNGRTGKYRYLALPQRVEDRPMPQVEVVDMRLYGKEKAKDLPVLSAHLLYAMEDTLKKKKQILLFLNRRGYNTFLICPECGYVFKCRNCAVSLTHHAVENRLKCHYCDYAVPAAFQCPECCGKHVCAYGTGTEKLEEEVKRFFPEARCVRMDSDTTARKGAFGKILQDLDRGVIDILVGTQMITKGHDFPNITLVGVVSADAMLNMPDFRAAERTFQTLMQVAGRGGRSVSPGKVIIQTFNPDHYAVKYTKKHDYEGFYQQELQIRQELSYPPWSRFVNLQISCGNQEQGMQGIENIRKLAQEFLMTEGLQGRIDLLGPAEAPIARIKGRYRWQFLLKSRNSALLNGFARHILENGRQNGLTIKCDVDPISFM
ncbi:MAG: primosomal protein N' [Deltaproteobacteria bacterium]|nr:primosomal protein N' [Deltaproteobacteria bacterium]